MDYLPKVVQDFVRTPSRSIFGRRQQFGTIKKIDAVRECHAQDMSAKGTPVPEIA